MGVDVKFFSEEEDKRDIDHCLALSFSVLPRVLSHPSLFFYRSFRRRTITERTDGRTSDNPIRLLIRPFVRLSITPPPRSGGHYVSLWAILDVLSLSVPSLAQVKPHAAWHQKFRGLDQKPREVLVGRVLIMIIMLKTLRGLQRELRRK